MLGVLDSGSPASVADATLFDLVGVDIEHDEPLYEIPLTVGGRFRPTPVFEVRLWLEPPEPDEKTVTDRHIAGIAVRNPQIVAVAHYYGLTIATCVPADPESKGGSESSGLRSVAARTRPDVRRHVDVAEPARCRRPALGRHSPPVENPRRLEEIAVHPSLPCRVAGPAPTTPRSAVRVERVDDDSKVHPMPIPHDAPEVRRRLAEMKGARVSCRWERCDRGVDVAGPDAD